jgi:hypothetical protein
MGSSTVDVSLAVAIKVLFPNLAKVFIIAYSGINVYILESILPLLWIGMRFLLDFDTVSVPASRGRLLLCH